MEVTFFGVDIATVRWFARLVGGIMLCIRLSLVTGGHMSPLVWATARQLSIAFPNYLLGLRLRPCEPFGTSGGSLVVFYTVSGVDTTFLKFPVVEVVKDCLLPFALVVLFRPSILGAVLWLIGRRLAFVQLMVCFVIQLRMQYDPQVVWMYGAGSCS